MRDTGPGIDPAVAERIFEPFFTTKPRGEGTGMGLAVVHGIVTGLHGTVTIESTLGEGSVFHVVLPTVEQEAAAEIDVQEALPSGNECILFVDDDPDITGMAEHMLKSLGYNPVTATHGNGALRLFQMDPNQFDLVIADLVMPQMSGEELVKEIRALRPEVPVIFCTGFSETFSPRNAAELGVKELIMKPIVMRQLADAVRRALDEAHVEPG